jgi:hypothetical protein
MRTRWFLYLIWIWVIVVGGYIIVFWPVPPEPPCLACGKPFSVVVGVIEIVLGLVGLVTNFAANKNLTSPR